MEHTIKLNIKELISLQKPDAIYDLVKSVIIDELTQNQYEELIAYMLDVDYKGYLQEENIHKDIQELIEKLVKHFKR